MGSDYIARGIKFGRLIVQKTVLLQLRVSAMADLVQQKIAIMLAAAQRAHHSYQERELNGKRNDQWPAWYADYLITNGLGGLLGHELDVDELAELLETCNRQFEAEGGQGNWQDYTANRLLLNLE
jgi:hypothetical protein